LYTQHHQGSRDHKKGKQKKSIFALHNVPINDFKVSKIELALRDTQPILSLKVHLEAHDHHVSSPPNQIAHR
jgi:hypothetical protein